MTARYNVGVENRQFGEGKSAYTSLHKALVDFHSFTKDKTGDVILIDNTLGKILIRASNGEFSGITCEKDCPSTRAKRITDRANACLDCIQRRYPP